MSESKLTQQQYKTFGPVAAPEYGETAAVYACVRFDDECNNGHNSFAITGTVRDRGSMVACGCIHDTIAKAFPHLAGLLKWHLCDTRGPLHYPANVLYLAGDRDHYGRAAGDASRWEYGIRFDGSEVTHRTSKEFHDWLKEHHGRYLFRVVRIDHEPEPDGRDLYGPKFTLECINGTGETHQYGKEWYQCPFDDEPAAREWEAALNDGPIPPEYVKTATEWSKGKPRELELARSSAVWPDATDEELTAPGLEERLAARLPQLLDEFRRDVESLGFTW